MAQMSFLRLENQTVLSESSIGLIRVLYKIRKVCSSRYEKARQIKLTNLLALLTVRLMCLSNFKFS